MSSLKRARSRQHGRNVPPLPSLTGDIILEVFTHKSIQFDGPNSEYGDNTRLAELGSQALQMVITRTLFDMKDPMLNVSEIAEHREGLLSDDSIDHWVKAYGLKRKVRCLPDAVPTLDTPEECRFLFNSYVGAVWVQHSPETVQNWITKLIRPGWDDREHALEPDPAGCSISPPPPKRIKNESIYVNTSLGQIQTPVVPPRFASSLPPFPGSSVPTFVQPPRNSLSVPPFSGLSVTTSEPPPSSARSTSSPPPPHFSASAPTHTRPNPLFLPIFNQAASQRKVNVEYQTTFHGPPHAGKWHAQCIVNGIKKGEGEGSSKQSAKDDAARQAYYAMGWVPNL